MWTALILGCAPDRFGSGFGPLSARVVQGNSRVAAQWRLTWILIIPYDPFPGKVGWTVLAADSFLGNVGTLTSIATTSRSKSPAILVRLTKSISPPGKSTVQKSK